jgi:hypothetical protein
MVAPARLITLNIGSQTLGLAEFRVVHGRLVLLNYHFRETPLDPATGQRRDAHDALHETAVMLREMMHGMHINRGPVNYAVPAQSVFSRFVKLPPLVEEKLVRCLVGMRMISAQVSVNQNRRQATTARSLPLVTFAS